MSMKALGISHLSGDRCDTKTTGTTMERVPRSAKGKKKKKKKYAERVPRRPRDGNQHTEIQHDPASPIHPATSVVTTRHGSRSVTSRSRVTLPRRQAQA